MLTEVAETRESRVIREMGLILDPAMSLDDVLTSIVEKTTRLMDAERSTLFLKNGDDALVSRILQGEGVKEIRLPPGRGIAGWCAEHGRSVCIPDAQDDPRFDQQWDREFQFRTKEVICRPIFDAHSRSVGVIEVLNKRSPGGFDKDDLVILSLIAEQIFLTIENSKLFFSLLKKNRDLVEAKRRLDHKNKEVILLLELERCVAESSDLDSLCRAVLQQTKQVTSAELAALYLEDQAGAEMRWIAGDNPVMKTVRSDERRGLLCRVAEKGEPIRSAQPSSSLPFSLELQPYFGRPLRHLAALPLCAPHVEGIRGTLAVENKMFGDGFDDGDFFFMTLIAERLRRAVAYFGRRDSQERDRRLATVGRLMAFVLHDIRSPMSLISGYAELLGRAVPGPETDAYLDRMNVAVRRITAMAEEIIAFSKGEREMLLTKVSIEPLMEAFMNDIRPKLEQQNITARLNLGVGGTVMIDQDKMLRVFHNIVCNAAEAMVGGGNILIETDRVQHRTLFRFTDDGPGIPEKIRGSVFQSFVTAGKTRGTGLGLAVTKEIVEAHGGAIRFTTEIGRGTTFIVEIPDRKDA